MTAPWEARLAEVVSAHGLPDPAPPRLRALLELIAKDPAAPTTVRDPDRAVELHVADALSGLALEAVRCAATIADLGAGAGFPGLPLAVARPDAAVALVEASSRKCAFLRRAVQACAAGNATVACTRAEESPLRDRDLVVARAVAPLAVLVEYAAPLLRLGGTLVAWKGRRLEGEEAAGVRAAALVGLEPAAVHRVAPRPGAAERHLYVYLKVSPTPDRFPRRPGIARKRPLAG